MSVLIAGRGAAPADLVATRHSGGSGAPSGTTRSPCQELADVSRRKSFPTLELKQGPLAGDAAIGAPRGAGVPQATSHKGSCAFRRAIPLIIRTPRRAAER